MHRYFAYFAKTTGTQGHFLRYSHVVNIFREDVDKSFITDLSVFKPFQGKSPFLLCKSFIYQSLHHE